MTENNEMTICESCDNPVYDPKDRFDKCNECREILEGHTENDELRELVEEWRDSMLFDEPHPAEPDSALEQCADDLEELIDDE